MPRLPANAGGPPARRSGALPTERGPRTLDYAPAPAVGFEHVPEEILQALVAEGILVGREVAASADAPTAMRRSDGSHYQLVTAWWASTSRFVILQARRELASLDARKLRPAGPWSAAGRVLYLPDGLGVTTSVWRRPSGPGAGGTAKHQRTDDPLELLPPEVAKPLVGGVSDAWRRIGTGWATETVVAMRTVPGRVKVLRAERQATSRRALDDADWTVETIDAAVTGSSEFSLGKGRRALPSASG